MRYTACFAAQTALSSGASEAARRNASSPPNFVFILADDLGWADVGCYGGDPSINSGQALHETPHIDKLAQQGMRFTHAYAAAPVCTPTRASIMTDNYPLRSGKGSLYEGGVRVPLIVRWPGVTQAGSVTAEPVCSIDFYRTILDIGGFAGDSKHNADVDGLSLVPLLKNPNATLKREALYWHYPHYYPTTSPVSSIRLGDWKLLEYFEENRVELYNLKADIGEQKDLVGQMPEKAQEM